MLIAALIFIAVTSCFSLPQNVSIGWIPFLGGILDMDASFSGLFSFLVALFFTSCIIGSVIYIALKSTNYSFDIFYCVSIILLLIFINPKALYFNQIYPATLCIVISGICFMKFQIFLAFMILSLSSLFYAPLIWSFPVALIITIFEYNDIRKSIVKAICGFALPFIYLLSFRFFFYDDVGEFINSYFVKILDYNSNFYSYDIIYIFLFIVILSIAIHSIVFAIKKILKQNLLTTDLIKVNAFSFLIFSFIFIAFFQYNDQPLNILLAPSIGILYSFHFSLNANKYATRVEIFLFMCAIILVKIAYFIN